MYNPENEVIRFDPDRDHHFRHNAGEGFTEFNAPITEEIPDAEFVKIALKGKFITKKSNKYFHGDKEIGTKQAQVVEYFENDEDLMAKFSEYYYANDTEE